VKFALAPQGSGQLLYRFFAAMAKNCIFAVA